MPLSDVWLRDEQIWAYNPVGQFTLHLTHKLVLQVKTIVPVRDALQS